MIFTVKTDQMPKIQPSKPIENNVFICLSFLIYFSFNAVFHVKIEYMHLKSNFKARLVPFGGSKIRKTSEIPWFSP